MKFKYGLDDKPPLGQMLLFGLQWLAVTIPVLIIIGKVVSGLQVGGGGGQVAYIQKIFFVVAVAVFAQVVWGHRLPIVIGPAAVLMVGIASSQGSSQAAVYTSILICGLLLSVLSATGLFAQLKRLFTPRIVAVILILIALTLTPTILNLVAAPTAKASSFANLNFSLVMVLGMFVAAKYLKGLWKATLTVWALLAGTLVYYLLFPQAPLETQGIPAVAAFWQNLNPTFAFDWGVFLSFLICFLALSVNDLGSIQAIGELIKPDGMQSRITRGITTTGLVNVLAGFLGVIGAVNYSFSPGVIVASGTASRLTLLPASLGLLILSFLPKTIAILGSIPAAVIGSSLIYLMCSQIAAGLQMALGQEYKFEFGLVMGLPLMLGIVISFLPPAVLNTFPPILRPVLGNGFVVGVLAVLIMEHLLFRQRD